MVLALFLYMNNWSWQRLEDYADNVVYVEFPQSFIYDKLGAYDFPLSFYQYRPSVAGNHKRHYLDLDLNQDQLSVAIKDSSEQQAVSVSRTKLQITNAGDYVLTVDIKEGADTPYVMSMGVLVRVGRSKMGLGSEPKKGNGIFLWSGAG
jgi:hypothetical protein